MVLSVPPARAITYPGGPSYNAFTHFWGTDANGNLYAGSFREGKIPFPLYMSVEATTLANAYPITVTVVWGDGAANSTVLQGPSQYYVQNLHTYTIAGTYNLNVSIFDAIGTGRSDVYPVRAWSGAPSVSGVAWIEGQGRVANLTRQTYAAQPIMAFVKNSGLKELFTSSITSTTTGYVAWYEDSWTNLIYNVTISNPIFLGEIYPVAWPGNVPQVITSPGTHQFWVKVTSPENPGLNITSPKMTVIYQAAAVPIVLKVSEPTSQIFVPNVQAVVTNTFTITNSAPFTVSLNDAITYAPASGGVSNVCCQNSPLQFWTQYGPGAIINGTLQTYLFTGSLGSSQPPIPYANPPLTQQGLLLQPGESATVTEEVVGAFLGSVPVGMNWYTRTFNPVAAASCQYFANPLPCTIQGTPISFQNSVVTGANPLIPSVTTAAANQLGNGTVLFTGYVFSLGTYTSLSVWFTFTAPNGTVYVRPALSLTAPAQVTDYVTGLAQGNYTQYALFAQAPDGTLFHGSFLTFIVASAVAGNVPGSSGQAFTTGFLYSLAVAVGMPAIFLGMILGILLIVLGLVGLMAFEYLFEGDLPGFAWLAFILLLVIANTLFFIWPSWIILIMVVVLGLEIWREVAGGEALGRGGANG